MGSMRDWFCFRCGDDFTAIEGCSCHFDELEPLDTLTEMRKYWGMESDTFDGNMPYPSNWLLMDAASPVPVLFSTAIGEGQVEYLAEGFKPSRPRARGCNSLFRTSIQFLWISTLGPSASPPCATRLGTSTT
jgi:hypothetical protein